MELALAVLVLTAYCHQVGQAAGTPGARLADSGPSCAPGPLRRTVHPLPGTSKIAVVAGRAPLVVCVAGGGQQVQERAHMKSGLRTVPEHAVWIDGVPVAPANPVPGQVARGFEVGHDALDGGASWTDIACSLARRSWCECRATRFCGSCETGHGLAVLHRTAFTPLRCSAVSAGEWSAGRCVLRRVSGSPRRASWSHPRTGPPRHGRPMGISSRI